MPGVRSIDLADLVTRLVHIREPDRELDNIVHAMLGGREPISTTDEAALRRSKWLEEETPRYTAGGSAILILAHHLGMTVRLVSENAGRAYRVEAISKEGVRKEAVAYTYGAAACAAMTAVVATDLEANHRQEASYTGLTKRG